VVVVDPGDLIAQLPVGQLDAPHDPLALQVSGGTEDRGKFALTPAAGEQLGELVKRWAVGVTSPEDLGEGISNGAGPRHARQGGDESHLRK
jgi:hypothetical protein